MMHVSALRATDANAAGLLTLAADVTRWPEWVPGVTQASATGEGAQVLVATPRPLTLQLSLETTPDEVSWVLLRGDVSALRGRLSVQADAEGTSVRLDLTIGWALPLPAPLRRQGERYLAELLVDRLLDLHGRDGREQGGVVVTGLPVTSA